MLVLSRRAQQQIVFPGLGITLSILQVRGRIVKVGIEAPAEIAVKRREVCVDENPLGEDPAGRISTSSAAPQGGPDDATATAEAVHRRRNQLNTLQLYVDAIQMRLERDEYVDAKNLVLTLLKNLDVDNYQISSPDTSESPDSSDSERTSDLQEISNPPRRIRVLVVEDSDNERGLMTYLLASHGFIVYVARDGCEALEQLRHGCGLPDIVLMDVGMPMGNGLEALCRMRQDPELRQLLIYAVTGSQRNPAEEPVGRGWDRWFAKPVDIEKLVAAMRNDCVVDSESTHHASAEVNR